MILKLYRKSCRQCQKDGKTDLLRKFISKRNNRPFSAYLVRGKDGKISFEFEPRPAKKPGAAPARGGKKAAKAAA